MNRCDIALHITSRSDKTTWHLAKFMSLQVGYVEPALGG